MEHFGQPLILMTTKYILEMHQKLLKMLEQLLKNIIVILMILSGDPIRIN